jgi:S-adenosylmethionine:diacylglycerol 3-amino-3-carboxypropyl transferase
MTARGASAWERGHFDSRSGPSRLLFGQMHEDSAIERRAFPAGGRILCVASAGCTAMALAPDHDVVAIDVNPAQVAYAAGRFAGAPAVKGTAERIMDGLRALAPAAGWHRSRVRDFLGLDSPSEQAAFWRRHLDTRRFRAAMDFVFSRSLLRALYARPFLLGLPENFGEVLRKRLERGFARHSNARNPYARALLLGELPSAAAPPEAACIRLVQADAADFLEGAPEGSFDGFALSNILDGTDEAFARRLRAAIRQAAAPRAIAVLRSFAEKPRFATGPSGEDLAAEDRALLWGIVRVAPAAAL